MYSFEGDFRRKPQQNLGGASCQQKTDRNAFVLQLQQQRQKREERKKQLHSAIKIQAWIRSYLIRKSTKQTEREEYDSIVSKINTDDVQLLSHLMIKLLFFFDENIDLNRLILLSQLLLKHWKKMLQHPGSNVQIRRLLSLHLHILRAHTESSLAVPLRMFEVFTSTNTTELPKDCNIVIGNTMLYLVNRGYFRDLHSLLSQKSPPLYGPSPNPPTPLCAALYDLIQRPLLLIEKVDIHDFDSTVMTEFISAFLCHSYSEPVELFLIPALSQDTRHRFPYNTFMHCLLDDTNYITNKLVNEVWLLHSVLALEPQNFVYEIIRIDNTKLPDNPIVLQYIKVLGKLTVNVCKKQVICEYDEPTNSQENPVEEDDESDSDSEASPAIVREEALLIKCIEFLNDESRCLMITCAEIGDDPLGGEFIEAMSHICYNLLLSHRMAVQKYRLLHTLAFKSSFVRSLWQWVASLRSPSPWAAGGAREAAGALQALCACRADATPDGVTRVVPALAAFCVLYNLLVSTLHDTEFYNVAEEEELFAVGRRCGHPFSLAELGGVCRALRQACVALLDLAWPDVRARPQPNEQNTWTQLFKAAARLLRGLYARDARLNFCGPDAWPLASPPSLLLPHRNRDERGFPSAKDIKSEIMLKEIPFLIPFASRVQMFQSLIAKEKADHFYELANFYDGPSISITARRTHLYEDAFDKLSPENAPDLKLKLRVKFLNPAGMEEAGVDGGGLFREFLSELLKSAFDPNRGLFRLTQDNMLYPNPSAHLLYDDYQRHYYFVGRMLGKAVYEQVLVEVPLAELFLSKAVAGAEPAVHALASLDPELYRGLLLLKAERGDVADLGLDFTLLILDLGEQRLIELKPGGANIPVTAENRIEYIHLVADFKLNKQIRSQCNAFKRGLTSVIKTEWLRMFSCKELQLLIAGAEVPIDIDDLKKHTHYGGGFSDTHPTIQFFWNAVRKFNDDQKRQLLKFVTSCSRPPLLGFKDLQPGFCIQSAGPSDRLPSSSTCMNLLKMPEFADEETLTEKLLYAIQSGAGFELS